MEQTANTSASRSSRIGAKRPSSDERGKGAYQGVALPGMEGDLLLRHGLGVDLRQRVGAAAEGRVDGAVHLVQPPRHRLRLPLLCHRTTLPPFAPSLPPRNPRRKPNQERGSERKRLGRGRFLSFALLMAVGS
ncbi:hypothetical protein B296_00021411 [Ensete ventricosum]|uniref:Uncharacterized protein n=1 Tax=Ensete ventricosum TaxID=4639 RepID=A0A427A8W3_ENSVE|nr:hypothetical protein B296_00021411 [Ensete ventricosum]